MRRNARTLVAVVSPAMALGTTDDELTSIATTLTAQFAAGNDASVATALGLLSDIDRQTVAAKMLALGADPTKLSAAITAAQPPPPTVPLWALLLHTAGMGVSAYHGYRRTGSVGWALVWGLLGGTFPIIVPVIALAEGFAQPARRA